MYHSTVNFRNGRFFYVKRPNNTLAFTTAGVMDLVGKIVHTEHDTMASVDKRKIEETAGSLYHIISALED